MKNVSLTPPEQHAQPEVLALNAETLTLELLEERLEFAELTMIKPPDCPSLQQCGCFSACGVN